MTNVYGSQGAGDKRDFLLSLRRLREEGMANAHLVVGGYFKFITSLEEKKGERRRLEEECETFRETIEDLGLVGIITREGWFRWNNKRTGDRHIASCWPDFLT